MPTTHLAGPPVTVSGRTVQRCPWCGFKLCDSRGATTPVAPDGRVPEFPTWPHGALVEVSDGNPTRCLTAGHWDDPGDLPPTFCYELVE